MFEIHVACVRHASNDQMTARWRVFWDGFVLNSDFEAQNVTTPPSVPLFPTVWWGQRPTKRRTRVYAYRPHATSWADALTTNKPRNSCYGATLHMPQAEISYGFDGQSITPSIESYENV